MTNAAALEGTVSVVTGAGGGIGGAVARWLSAAGSETVMVGRTEASLATTAGGCEAGVRTAVADLTAPEAAGIVLQQLGGEQGRLDVLVHAAGAMETGSVAETSVDGFDRQFAVNVRAVYTLTQRLLPLLRRSRGQIVVVNSSAIAGPRPGAGPYAATKHALLGLTDALRQEENPNGIRVLSVFPGQTATELQRRLYDESGREYRPEALLQPDDVARIVLAALTMPRTAEVTDIHVRPMQKPG